MKAKKVFSMLLAVVLACSMLATYAFATADKEYNVWVGGVRVTSANMDDVLGDGTVKYTPANGCDPAKLTLDGATVNGNGCVTYGAGIYSCDALVIETVSASTVNGADSGSLLSAAIAGTCNLTFTGSGKLTVNGASVCAGSSYGIHSVAGTVRFNSANVVAKSAKAFCNSFAVFAPTVIVNGGKLVAEADSYAIDSVGIKAVTLIVNSGNVLAKGGEKCGCPIFKSSYGLCAGTITVKGGTVVAHGDSMAMFGILNLCKYKCPCIYAGKKYDGSDACIWKDCLLDCLCNYKYVKICPWECPVCNNTLTFVTNGGTAIDPVVAPNGTVIDLSAYTTTKEGFEFAGWYLDPDFKTPVDNVHLCADTTVYAKWTPVEVPATMYTLTFDVNGGVPEYDPITDVEGTVVDLASYVPSKEGYTFAGWCTDPELQNVVASVTLDGNKTVYAKWIENTPVVDDTEVLVKIPFTKNVTIGKNTAPGKATFSFTVKAVEDVSFSVVKNSIETNGKGDFDGEIVLKVKKVDLEKLGKGIEIAEVKSADADWACSTDKWVVKFTVCGDDLTFSFFKNGACESASELAFANVYNKYTTPDDDTPDTGDSTHALLLALISVLSMAGIAIVSSKKSFEK